MRKNLTSNLTLLYEKTNTWSGGILGIFYRAATTFTQTRASEASAGLAYYAFFSLFPLIVLLVAIGAVFLEGSSALSQAIFFLERVLPFSQNLIERNLDAIFQLRGPVGLLSFIGLFWAGTNVFSVLSLHVNRAFPEAYARNFFQARLVALVIGAALVVGFTISLLLIALVSFIPWAKTPLVDVETLELYRYWRIGASILTWAFIVLVFYILYRWLPTVKVQRLAAFWGAVVASTLWRISASLLAWYLNTGLVNLELIYGSVGAVVLLMLWIYLSSSIALFGAHLTAAIQKTADPKPAPLKEDIGETI